MYCKKEDSAAKKRIFARKKTLQWIARKKTLQRKTGATQRVLQIQSLTLEVKEKRLEELHNLIKISEEQLRNKLFDLHVQELAAASIDDISLQLPAETEPHLYMFKYATRQDVSQCISNSPLSPAETVLNLMQGTLSTNLVLSNEYVQLCFLFFDELGKVQRFEELPNIQEPGMMSQLQLKATQVATIWKSKMRESSLEALSFLMFLVAYGLQKLINQDETALLASKSAHYEQAPRLFYFLGLKLETIQEFVKELIKKREFIPAVRLICLFKLHKEFSVSPSELLMEEINSFGLWQDKDAGRLTTILKLARDFKLDDISLPGHLIVNLMVQREIPTHLVQCPAKTEESISSPNPQA